MFYGGLMGYYFDPTWILVIIGAVLSMAASAKVNSTFSKYSKVRSMTGMTGEDAAKRLLNSQGIYDVTVRPVKGQLTDHYDPRTKTVNLSESVFHSTSVRPCHAGQRGIRPVKAAGGDRSGGKYRLTGGISAYYYRGADRRHGISPCKYRADSLFTGRYFPADHASRGVKRFQKSDYTA